MKILPSSAQLAVIKGSLKLNNYTISLVLFYLFMNTLTVAAYI